MQQFWLFILLFWIFSIIYPGIGYRTQKASRRTLDHIKQLITMKARRHVESADPGALIDQVIFQKRDPEAKRHQDELAVNDLDAYFQGDVDLSEKQAEIISKRLEDESSFKDKDDESIRKKRKVGREPLYVRWDRTRPISYDFSETIPLETKHKIRAAIAMWEKQTCVRFQENGPNVDRIEFFDGGGCSSFVGRTGGTQGISISTPGCDNVGIISHEIGHALGVFHEQARPDQYSHILINYNNIPISRWNNFYPLSQAEANTFNLPYDTGSVMHYGAYGFAADPYVPTITTRDKFQQYTIGQREGPSFLDYAAINIAYRCTEHCTYMQCEHDGYPNPNNCAQCLCPDGFAGRTCEFVQYTPCGAFIKVTRKPVTISSPNYPDFFKIGDQCIWLIEAPRGGFVNLQFIEQFQLQCEDTCDKSYVEVKISDDFRVTGYRFCCSKAPKQMFQSVTNEMIVIFRGFGDPGKGFKAEIWSNIDDEEATTKITLPEIPTVPTDKKIIVPSTAATVLPSSTNFILPSSSTATTISSITVTTDTITTKKNLTTVPIFTSPSTVPPSVIKFLPPVTESTSVEENHFKVSTSVPAISVEIQTLCKCGEWSEWTGPCSQQCGGCGKRFRKRSCSSSTECRTEDKRACNFKVCPHGTNFLINNGEFHILWKGCCVGLFRSGDTCSALDNNENPFLKILETLLNAQDARRHRTLDSDGNTTKS